MIASASAQFGKDQTRAGVGLSQRDIEIRRGQAVGDTDIGMRRDLQTGAGHTSAEKNQTLGSSLGPLGAQPNDRPTVERAAPNAAGP